MKKIRGFLIFIFFTVNSCGVRADDSSQQLARLLENVDTFSAEFQQTLVSAKGSTIQRVSGQLKAMRPGLFYWYTAPPLEQILVTDGDQVWLYDPDLEQVTIQGLSAQFSRTPALLLSGEVEDIDGQYTVSQVNNENQKTAFQLVPKSPDSLFDSLYLAFDARQQLALMQLKDSLGQETTLEFKSQQVNQGVSKDDFVFEMPDGVDVIRQ